MNKPLRINNPVFKIINNSLIDSPVPTNISFMWNYGSMLGLCLMIQIMTGLFLAMHYTPNVEMAFSSVIHICRDVNNGWLMRTIHANGASFFYQSMHSSQMSPMLWIMYAWTLGTMIMFMVMATAFLGYVLPWGQMSFWGATVITNLLSTIPYIGTDLVQWIWGGFVVNNATLNRLFTFHFMLPFIIASMVVIHLFYLHMTGSSNPLGLNSNIDKIPFHPYFTFKDTITFLMMITMLIMILLISAILIWVFHGFPSSLQANAGMVPHNSPWAPPAMSCASLANHYLSW